MKGQPAAAAGSGAANGATSRPGAEKAGAAAVAEQTLGQYLVAARERRGLKTEEVTAETRIPAHYLRMMETDDYDEISDQLYLVPFLRRYASFLELDQEEVAMRFVREVQRADSVPPARLDQPLSREPRKRRGWTGAMVVAGFLAVAVGLYLYESDRHRQTGASGQSASVTVSGSTGKAPAPGAPPAPAGQ